jgi:hypothetical protein
MPFMPPLKKAQPQPKIKQTRRTPPGGGHVRKVKVTGRDPRRKSG